MEITFINPNYLWILLIVPALVIFHLYLIKYKKKLALSFSNYEIIEKVMKRKIFNYNLLSLILRITILIFLIFSAGGMVFWYQGPSTNFDIVLAIDSSSSMLATDYNPSRIDSAKNSINLFLDALPGKTQIGLISFAGAVLIEHDLTTDYGEIKDVVNNVQVSAITGTDFGNAIITSSNMLKEGNKGKKVILLTDGQSSIDSIKEGVEYAKLNNVQIDTIGMATTGQLVSRFNLTSRLNEDLLKMIAQDTGGDYYFAEDENSLAQIYENVAVSNQHLIPVKLAPILILLAILTLIIHWIVLFQIGVIP